MDDAYPDLDPYGNPAGLAPDINHPDSAWQEMMTPHVEDWDDDASGD